MSAKVKVRVLEGAYPGMEYVFDRSTKWVVGSAADCQLSLPSDEYFTVSGHHCLLSIDPPHIWVRDLGSLNGTFVNGLKIGQRSTYHLVEDTVMTPTLYRLLESGDKLQVGKWIFGVDVEILKKTEKTLSPKSGPTTSSRTCSKASTRSKPNVKMLPRA